MMDESGLYSCQVALQENGACGQNGICTCTNVYCLTTWRVVETEAHRSGPGDEEAMLMFV